MERKERRERSEEWRDRRRVGGREERRREGGREERRREEKREERGEENGGDRRSWLALIWDSWIWVYALLFVCDDRLDDARCYEFYWTSTKYFVKKKLYRYAATNAHFEGNEHRLVWCSSNDFPLFISRVILRPKPGCKFSHDQHRYISWVVYIYWFWWLWYRSKHLSTKWVPRKRNSCAYYVRILLS